ncbi:MAG: hypothetical protein Q9162_002775 [Coniocarpon cinnabarinum]
MARELAHVGIIESELRLRAARIRDELVHICPDENDVAQLHALFTRLETVSLGKSILKRSRIHLAMLEILESAKLWPPALIKLVQDVLRMWLLEYGDLRNIGVELYGKSGRLYGICKPEDTSWRAMINNWQNERNLVVNPEVAKQPGNCGFKPGAWWIHPVFAYHDGIISSGDPKGGLTYDSEGCYAIVLTIHDIVKDHNLLEFSYQIRHQDEGRPRLLAAMLPEKAHIRVLRSYTVKSDYAPSLGIRYDGLNIQRPMRAALDHPTAAERDDYLEFQRIRSQAMRTENARRCQEQDQPKPHQIPHENTPTARPHVSHRAPSSASRHSSSALGSRTPEPLMEPTQFMFPFPNLRRGAAIADFRAPVLGDESPKGTAASPEQRAEPVSRADEDELLELRGFRFPWSSSQWGLGAAWVRRMEEEE